MTATPLRSSLAAALAAVLAAALIVPGAMLAAPAMAQTAQPTTSFSLGGAVDHPATYDLAKLLAQPAVTQTVSFGSGSGPQTHTYTGASLWGVLDGAGIATDPKVKNDILSKYVVATGSDGYRVAFSAGELNPAFGNRPDLIAYAETIGGTQSPLTGDGFARTTAPGDVKGGRYVSNLSRVDVGGVAPAASKSGGPTTSFSVSGDVTHATSFDLAALKALPQTQQTVNGTLYTGVSFWDLLNTKVGIATNPAVKNDLLGMVVVATGSDGYRATFSLGELSPSFGNQPDLIAYAANGAPLTDNGFARLVVPNDIKAGRYVSNLTSIDVFHATAPVPEPGTLALMLVGVAALGAGFRRARPGSRSTP